MNSSADIGMFTLVSNQLLTIAAYASVGLRELTFYKGQSIKFRFCVISSSPVNRHVVRAGQTAS